MTPLQQAVKSALDTLIEIRDNGFSWCSNYDIVIKELKNALKEIKYK